MSYAAGQFFPSGPMKYVAGQRNFRGDMTAESLSPGYIEHGSWMTGESDIVQFGYEAGRGMGQVLTSFACDPTSVSAAFRGRLTGALDAGTQAALVGGAVAGVVGAIAGKRSLVAGLVAGGIIGWTANLVWTSTHRP
jgi:hypothetical protein